MTYACTMEVPASPEVYRRVRAKLGDQSPKGLVFHLAVQSENGLRHIDVWDSEADWNRFSQEQLMPAVAQTLAELGITPPAGPPERSPLEIVGVWAP